MRVLIDRRLVRLMLVLGSAWAVAGPSAANEPGTWPARVLITNDDGIERPSLRALGEAFSKVAETFIVAPDRNRSGSSDETKFGKHGGTLRVSRAYAADSLTAYSINGFPSDCVTFGVRGLLEDRPPDLVVSGINGGPNLGDDAWIISGTIGAARTAAFLGIPAIAVSGLDGGDGPMVELAARWVVRLARSPVVRDLEPGQYLTVSIPRTPPSQIRGVRLAERAARVEEFEFVRASSPTGEDRGGAEEVWVVKQGRRGQRDPGETDWRMYNKNYIVVVPMRVGETDREALRRLRGDVEALPPWPPKGAVREGG